MCGRYTLTTTDYKRLGERFGAELPEEGGGRYNVAPTEEILVVDSGRHGRIVAWGLYGKLINARSETMGEKPGFARLARSQKGRVLVLADGFYEWLRAENPRQPRRPFRFTLADGAPFAMAGLCNGGEATVLTCAPNEVVARLHDRMPVILPGPEAEAAWLSADLGVEDLAELCTPLEAGRMVASPVSARVNKAGIDEGPDLLEPDPLQEEMTLF